MLPIIKNQRELAERLQKRQVLLTTEMKNVEQILTEVQKKGDTALKELTLKYDKVSIQKLKVSHRQLKKAQKSMDSALDSALHKAAENIQRFHQKQTPREVQLTQPDKSKVSLGWRPIKRVGIYIPGGRFPLLSTVLMNVIPAQVAGVKEIAICSPPTSSGLPHNTILGTCAIMNIKEVYSMGGAQAIAALAFGTRSIPPVDKITGPGNIWVTAAKHAVSPFVGIDMLAGPTELVVIADETANHDFIAADLISQAEHDPKAWPVLITNSATLAVKVNGSISRLLENLTTRDIAEESLTKHGFIYLGKTVEACINIANEISAEHVSLQVTNPKAWVKDVIAGSILLGPLTSITWGDYWSGSNHILPTSGQARSRGLLSVFDFLVQYSVIQTNSDALKTSGEEVIRLAASEGLQGHALAVEMRRGDA